MSFVKIGSTLYNLDHISSVREISRDTFYVKVTVFSPGDDAVPWQGEMSVDDFNALDRTHTTFPAHPGYFALDTLDDFTDVMSSPILAWQTDMAGYIEPIALDQFWSYGGGSGILCPDGRVISARGDRVDPDIRSWLDSLRKAVAA